VIARHSAAHFGAVVPRNLLLRSDRDRKQKRQGHDREPAHISLPLSGGRHEAASGQGRKPPAPRWAETAASRFGDQTSRLATDSAFVWMKSRRGSTSSPINRSKISWAISACSASTRNSERLAGSSVVSHSCSAFISPSPL